MMQKQRQLRLTEPRASTHGRAMRRVGATEDDQRIPAGGSSHLAGTALADPRHATVAALQRTLGNREVQRLLSGGAPRIDRAVNHKEINEDEEPIQLKRDPSLARSLQRTVDAGRLGDVLRLIQREVAPTFPVNRPAPIRSNSDASTTKVKAQSFGGKVKKDDAKKAWTYELDSYTSNGEIQIVYYTNDHYPAPAPEDDSGALTNVNSGNWKDVADDLHAERTGIAEDWSAYRAEGLHEDYHWNTEWVNTLTPELRKAEAKLAKIKVPYKKGLFGKKERTDAEGEQAAKEKASKVMADTVKTAKKKYFKLGDSPGDPPYIAQAPAIDALENRVRTHAKDQAWEGA